MKILIIVMLLFVGCSDPAGAAKGKSMYTMSECERVSTYPHVRRCENHEVTCYVITHRDGAGISCKWKTE